MHPDVVDIAQRHGRSVSEVIFRFALDLGMIALTGTTNADHMHVDLSIVDFDLEAAEVARIEGLMAR